MPEEQDSWASKQNWQHFDRITTKRLNRYEDEIYNLHNNQSQTFSINNAGLVPGPSVNDAGKFLSTNGWALANTVQQEVVPEMVNIENEDEINVNYPILISKYNNDNSNSYVDTVYRTNNNVYINVNDNTIHATSFIGSIAGSNVTGTINAEVLPVATTAVRGAVICGDGLTMNDGAIKVENPLPASSVEKKGAFLRIGPTGRWIIDELQFATNIAY